MHNWPWWTITRFRAIYPPLPRLLMSIRCNELCAWAAVRVYILIKSSRSCLPRRRGPLKEVSYIRARALLNSMMMDERSRAAGAYISERCRFSDARGEKRRALCGFRCGAEARATGRQSITVERAKGRQNFVWIMNLPNSGPRRARGSFEYELTRARFTLGSSRPAAVEWGVGAHLSPSERRQCSGSTLCPLSKGFAFWYAQGLGNIIRRFVHCILPVLARRGFPYPEMPLSFVCACNCRLDRISPGSSKIRLTLSTWCAIRINRVSLKKAQLFNLIYYFYRRQTFTKSVGETFW